jgi:hypothetical protein
MFAPALWRRSRGGSYVPPGGYFWYPDFDVTLMPFQTASGPWGAQYSHRAASAPAITSTSVATTFAQLQTALNVEGRQVTMGATIDCLGMGALGGNIRGVELVIPPEYMLLNPVFNQVGGIMQDFLIRGPTLGKDANACTGGQVHNLLINSSWGSASSFVLDSVKVSGPGLVGAIPDASQAIDFAMTIDKVAIQYCQIMAGCEAMLSRAADMTVCGCSIQTANLMPEPVEDESWRFRITPFALGLQAFYKNDMRVPLSGRTNVFHAIRVHPNGNDRLVWVGRNRMVDLLEARHLWVNAAAGGGTGNLAGFFTFENHAYGHQVTSGRSWSSDNSLYVEHKDNQFYGDAFTNETLLNNLTSGDTNGRLISGNVFNDTSNPAPTIPAWGSGGIGTGDPTGIDWDLPS